MRRDDPGGPSTARERGFTLLEVMVAIAILGLGLAVILTAQTGLFSSSKRAATLSTAVGLARCKMNEIEEELLRQGFQLTTEDEEGPCCEDDESELRCKWSISTVTLPELGAGGGADAGAGAPEGEEGASSMLSLEGLDQAKDELAQGDTAGAIGGLSGLLGGASAGAGPSLGAGALAPLAMGLIWPNLKAMLEASIRKVTVRVVWKEGSLERDLSVTQYVTNPQQGGFLATDETGAAGAGAMGGPSPRPLAPRSR